MISAEHLSVHFKRSLRGRVLKALDDVTLEIREGEFFALLGENGAGKSTAMHCFLGLVRPTRGTVTLMGQRPYFGAPLFERVAYLPEEPHYPAYLTVGESLDYYASLFPTAIPRQKRDELLERLGLGSFRDLRVGKCSKGMKQKLGIAQALVNEPRVLLLDEPMRGLDPVGVRDFREVLLDYHRNGATIVMNSHILSEVESVATRVAILKQGRLIANDETRNLTRSEGELYHVEFEGDGEVPSFISNVQRQGAVLHATVPVSRFPEFVRYAEANSARIYSCQLRRRTLEESFLSLVKQEAPSGGDTAVE